MPASFCGVESMAKMPSTKFALPPTIVPFSMTIKSVPFCADCTAHAIPDPPQPTMRRSVSYTLSIDSGTHRRSPPEAEVLALESSEPLDCELGEHAASVPRPATTPKADAPARKFLLVIPRDFLFVSGIVRPFLPQPRVGCLRPEYVIYTLCQ